MTKLERTLEKLRGEEARLATVVAEAPQKERAAVATALAAGEGSPYKVGGTAATIASRAAKAESRLSNLRVELEEAERLRAAEAEQEAEQEARVFAAQARTIVRRELGVWTRAGEAFQALATAWGEIQAAGVELDRLNHHVRHEWAKRSYTEAPFSRPLSEPPRDMEGFVRLMSDAFTDREPYPSGTQRTLAEHLGWGTNRKDSQ